VIGLGYLFLPTSSPTEPNIPRAATVHGFIIVSMIFFVTCGYPLYLDYVERNPGSCLAPSHVGVSPAPVEGQYSNLNQTLQSPQGTIAFEEFLKLEFSVENLLFFLRAKDFRDKFGDLTDQENIQRANLIYRQFISRNSPFQVNLSDTSHRTLHQLFESRPSYIANASLHASNQVHLQHTTIHQNTFEQAMNQVFLLMSNDTFPRFKKSEVFKRLANSSFVLPTSSLPNHQSHQMLP
jgi:hypothetical protein